jgi:hypothetical protein
MSSVPRINPNMPSNGMAMSFSPGNLGLANQATHISANIAFGVPVNSKFKIPDKFSADAFSRHGFRKATPREIAGGSAPFVFEHFSTDSKECAVAKAQYNNTSALAFSANQDYFSPLEPFFQMVAVVKTMEMTSAQIASRCLPTGYKL